MPPSISHIRVVLPYQSRVSAASDIAVTDIGFWDFNLTP